MVREPPTYTVAYDKKDGTIGFLGTDGPSGYPYFTDRPSPNHIKTDVLKAHKLLKEVTSMTGYYGHNEVDFNSVRVVRIDKTYTDLDLTTDDLTREVVNQAKAKLSSEELVALEQMLSGEIS